MNKLIGKWLDPKLVVPSERGKEVLVLIDMGDYREIDIAWLEYGLGWFKSDDQIKNVIAWAFMPDKEDLE